MSILDFSTTKIDLPIDEFVASIEDPDDITEDTLNLENLKSDQFLMDFTSILEGVDIQNQLTPPQTPPYVSGLQDIQQQPQQQQINDIPVQPDQYQIFNNYEHHQQPEDQFVFIQNATVAETPENDITIFYTENSNSRESSMISSDEINCQEIILDAETIISSPTDLQREQEVVNELVREHSRQKSPVLDYDTNSSTAWSPRSDYSSGSSHYDYYEPVKKSSSGLRGVTKKRSRGYGRNPEEKKSRKKEQNKNAATRYRMKKKQEVEVILDEEKILMDKNRKLTTAYKDTKREVKYLKSLLKDLFKARGFI